ncbi:hypothetical protein CUMW_183310 [Citrus unshiu]|uniref:Uncharacterized protein n=1 Tax=Citrus unshiu TaxID=55188 RepID=A0A2H5Q037_CITUN|nr:hypothetical protein CUMW_183310 [Citrus unshiu]
MAIRSKTFRTLRIAPHHQSIYIRILSNRIMTHHQSMPYHRSMPRHHSVCVNSVMNTNMDNTVHVNSTIHVNNVIFFYAPPKVFDCPEFKSDVRFAVCEMTMMPLKYIKYFIKIKHT